MFVGRQAELRVLNELAESGNPELYVLFGRRRVGKTELLQQFCRRRRAVYFLGAEVREKDNLRAFRDALAEGLDDPLVANVEFKDWTAALQYAGERAREERLVLVLDEFPYLCESSPSLPSEIQRFWDTKAKKTRLMLVLCGSQVSFMEQEVLAERSPLFGRRTAQRRLEPLSPSDALTFFPKWPLKDRVLAYAMLGGMPAYLRRFEDERSLQENLLRECFRPEGYLFDEVQFLLRSELSNPATYNSILAAVARDVDKVGDIALSVGVDSTHANKYLSILRELRLVDRDVPMTDPDPLRSRKGTYRIADRFLAFHFRHIHPHAGLIQAGRGGRVLEEFVEPDFARLFEEATVEFVLEHLRAYGAEVVDEEIVEVARSPGLFVRAVAKTAGGRGVAAIVDPSGDQPTTALEEEIAELEAALGPKIERLHYEWTKDPARPVKARRGQASRRS
jgi:AAA+ ATPase superfamily predicted ATPase